MEDKISVGKAIINKLDTIISYEINNEKKLISLHNENMQLHRLLGDYSSILSQLRVPYMTPKQLYSMYQRGASLADLQAISGYDPEEIKKKINNYKNA